MDLDLTQARAFVTAADLLHFTRAAERLSISQQSLSQRISKLERHLDARLFVRSTRSVTLTDAGRRFLAPAREALAAGQSAMTVITRDRRPLRIDVWGNLFGPQRTIGPAIDALPNLDVELGMCRDMTAAVASVERNDIDAAFGRVQPPTIEGVTHRLVRLEPVDAVLSVEHPLSQRRQLRPDELRDSRAWFPAAAHRLDFLSRFCEWFGIPVEPGGVNLGTEHLVDSIAADPSRFTLFPADAVLPDDSRVRTVPTVEPTPLYAWSLLWANRTEPPRLEELLRGLTETGRHRRWRELDPSSDWLPVTDRDKLDQGNHHVSFPSWSA